MQNVQADEIKKQQLIEVLDGFDIKVLSKLDQLLYHTLPNQVKNEMISILLNPIGESKRPESCMMDVLNLYQMCYPGIDLEVLIRFEQVKSLLNSFENYQNARKFMKAYLKKRKEEQMDSITSKSQFVKE